jgi:predicted nucleic acid-binding protein
MKDKYFIDTNIFVYLHDSTDKDKQEKSADIIDMALKENCGIISYQVVQEFINVVETKIENKKIRDNLKYFLTNCMYPLCSVFVDFDLYDLAIDIKRKKKLSFYDSLIVASAKRGGCNILYTEDLHAGKFDKGFEIINPF